MSINSHRPVRVTLVRECELVTAGFAHMLRGYSDRVQVVPSGPKGEPARHVDITLHDTLADVRAFPGVAARPVPHDGRLVTWTWNARPDLVDLALRNGSSGVLGKDLPAITMVAALEAIHHGRVVVKAGVQPHGVRRGADEVLTPREADVIALITRGLDNNSIAAETGVSINSVKSYIRSAYRKMQVTSRSQAVLWGVRNGYLDPTSGGPAASPALDADPGVTPVRTA